MWVEDRRGGKSCHFYFETVAERKIITERFALSRSPMSF